MSAIFPSESFDGDSNPWLHEDILAPWWEVVAVLVVLIGPFAAASAWMALHGSSNHYINLLLTNSNLIHNGIREGGTLVLMLIFLDWRGWNFSDFRIEPGWGSTLRGFLLFLTASGGNLAAVTGMFSLVFALQTAFTRFLPFLLANSPHLLPHSIELSWPVIIGAMVLNAIFEEMIFMGYAFNQFAAHRGPLFALLLTVLLRMSCHTYQGPVHVIGIGVAFLLFGICYWRVRNLWSLIIAHIFLDMVSVGFLKVLYS